MLRTFAATLLSAVLGMPLVAQNVTFANHTSPASSTIAAHGDFNNDGREDFLEWKGFGTNQNGLQSIISTGDGTYKLGPTYVLPQNTGDGVVIADFNGDGKLDFAVAGSNTIYVYFGNGNGTFRLGRTITVASGVTDIAAADFNHDSKTDLLVLTQTNTAALLIVYFGNGAGAFSKGPVSAVGNGGYAFAGIGDFDGDGNSDVVVRTNCDPGGCALLVAYGDGTGKFGSFFVFGSSGGEATAADVNGDKRTDLIAPAECNNPNCGALNFLEVFYGNADRTLTSAQIPIQCGGANGVAVADFNGDGIPDLMVAEVGCSGTSTQQMAFLRGTGAGTFAPEQYVFSSTVNVGSDTVALLGDRDTEPDFAFTEGNVGGPLTLHVMLNGTAATFPSCAAPHGVRGINVCSPLAGSTVSSPVHFAIGAAGSVPMRKVEVWVDGKKLKEDFNAFSDYSFMDTRLSLTRGFHHVTVFAAGWDNSLQKKAFTLTVR